jgi:hypothetical protein
LICEAGHEHPATPVDHRRAGVGSDRRGVDRGDGAALDKHMAVGQSVGNAVEDPDVLNDQP